MEGAKASTLSFSGGSCWPHVVSASPSSQAQLPEMLPQKLTQIMPLLADGFWTNPCCLSALSSHLEWEAGPSLGPWGAGPWI